MPDPKKKPMPQSFTLELSTLGDMRLEPEKPKAELKPVTPPKDDVNEDMIHRLINCVKKI